nr:transposase [Dissulfuribacter thermophilus]
MKYLSTSAYPPPGIFGKLASCIIWENDNESAKMKTSKGVIQGYNGLVMVDDKHQVIVHAEAFGNGQEQHLLEPMIEGTSKTCKVLSPEEDVFKKVKLTADAGFHTKKNMEMVFSQGIDAYIADRHFRKRDPRFRDRDRFKQRARKERKSRLFTPRDFIFDMEQQSCICSAEKHLYVKNKNFVTRNGYKAIAFMGKKTECRVCKLRELCLRYPDRTEARQVHFFFIARRIVQAAPS